jgi:hypothetical protein
VNSAQRHVDEGLTIALSAARMAVKNHIIVGALREHDDFDPAGYAAVAREELTVLAVQNEEDADRVARLRRDLAARRWAEDFSDDERLDLIRLARRCRVHKGLALVLHAVARDEAQLAGIVDSARLDASHELRTALAARLIRQTIDGHAPGYQRLREERLRYLLAIDFAALQDAAARPGPAGPGGPTA